MATTKSSATSKTAPVTEPATDFEASGAVMEPGVKKAVDMSHPAVDSHPRENVPPESNQIDFNDPGQSQKDAVAEKLAGQS